MRKFVVTVFTLLFCLSLSTLAQVKSDEPIENNSDPDGPPTAVTIFELGTSVTMDSFGHAGHSTMGCASISEMGRSGFRVDEPPDTSVLCEHTDFMAVPGYLNGRVFAIGPQNQNCTIVDRVTVTPGEPDHSTSAVQCGPCRVNYHHAADGKVGGWFTIVTIIAKDLDEQPTNCLPSCFYSYTDYDVHGFANNGSSFQAGQGFDLYNGLGRFVVRNNQSMPSVHYAFADGSGATRWAQAEFPQLRDSISGATTCPNLPNGPAMFPNGDFTGAFQYGFNRMGTDDNPLVVQYAHGRDDAMPFP